MRKIEREREREIYMSGWLHRCNERIARLKIPFLQYIYIYILRHLMTNVSWWWIKSENGEWRLMQRAWCKWEKGNNIRERKKERECVRWVELRWYKCEGGKLNRADSWLVWWSTPCRYNIVICIISIYFYWRWENIYL